MFDLNIQLNQHKDHEYLKAIVDFLKAEGFENIFKNKSIDLEILKSQFNIDARYSIGLFDYSPYKKGGLDHYIVYFRILADSYEVGKAVSEYIFNLFNQKYQFYLDATNKKFLVAKSEDDNKGGKSQFIEGKTNTKIAFNHTITFIMQD